MSIVNFPRVELAHIPTPFEHFERLGSHLTLQSSLYLRVA